VAATFVPSSLTDDDARPLIAALNAHALSVYPNPDDHHWSFSHEEGLFVVAYVDGVPAGCGGVRNFGDGTAELKRMYVDPAFRGNGVGFALVAHLTEHARALGVQRLLLETGVLLEAAVRLYQRCGFREIDRYGEYADLPQSLCMGKDL
jgi:putative acetyltransferase